MNPYAEALLEVERLRDQLRQANERAEKAEAELFGVMHSVDKWFPENFSQNNPATRAANARELALQEIEKRDSENQRLQAEVKALISKWDRARNAGDSARAENERRGKALETIFEYVYCPNQGAYLTKLCSEALSPQPTSRTQSHIPTACRRRVVLDEHDGRRIKQGWLWDYCNFSLPCPHHPTRSRRD